MSTQTSIIVRGAGGAELSLRRLPAPGRPRLILSHGNGFAIDGYRAFWSLLEGEFDLVLFDLRNHGRSGRTSVEAHTIRAMAQDHFIVAATCREAFGERVTFGVFHSVSAIAAALAGAAAALWDGVVLVDPPLVTRDAQRDLAPSADGRLADFARSRPERFGSAEELAATLSAGAGRRWREGAALDMARAVTRESPAGGVELVCPGEYEARIYEENALTDSYAALGAVKDPVAILGADAAAPRALHPALVSKSAAAEYGLAYASVEGSSHMLQIEKPAASAAALRALLGGFPRARP